MERFGYVAAVAFAFHLFINRGECVFGSMVFEFLVPGLPQMLANAGAEFIMYCMEHTGTGYETQHTPSRLRDSRSPAATCASSRPSLEVA